MRADAFCRRLLSGLAAAALIASVPATAGAADAAAPEVAVVVAAASEIHRIETAELRDLFLRRRTLLEDGRRAVPINLPVGMAARDTFSAEVLGRSPGELASYWDRLYYEGLRPPIVLPSADAVRAYLQADERAVGYLLRADVDESVRVLLTLPAARSGAR